MHLKLSHKTLPFGPAYYIFATHTIILEFHVFHATVVYINFNSAHHNIELKSARHVKKVKSQSFCIFIILHTKVKFPKILHSGLKYKDDFL